MNNELKSLIRELEISLDGQPWYGRSVYEILNEVKEEEAFKKPTADAHSLIDLLYHMLTWASFTLKKN